MQVIKQRKSVLLHLLSYFTTGAPSKKRKTGNVERLFSKSGKISLYKTVFAAVFLCTVVGLSLLSMGALWQGAVEESRETPFALSEQSAALTPMSAPTVFYVEGSADISVFYMMGDRGENIMALENALLSLGYDVGNVDGIYSHMTAEAVRRFQADRGLSVDGICTEALCHTAISLAQSGHMRQKNVSEGILADALYRAGCMTEEDALSSTQNAQLLRDALILFQRSRGLNGIGEVNYATLSALGLDGIFVYTDDAGANDLETYLIASYLARFSACYPQSSDLHTLICVASSLYNRAVLYGGTEPSLSVVCSAPIIGEKRAVSNAVAPNALCLRAAEDALLRLSNGDDPVRGATDYCHSSYYEEYAKRAQNDTKTEPVLARRVGELYFFK